MESGKLDLVESSPDGRYLLALRPTSAAYGELVLYDLAQGGPASVASRAVELSLKAIPALWSPDSDFFLYGKRGQPLLLFRQPAGAEGVLAESYRLLGKGTVRNVRWGPASATAEGTALYYVADRWFTA